VFQPSHSFYDTLHGIMTRTAISKLVRSSSQSLRPLVSRSSSTTIRSSILRPAVLPITSHGFRGSSIQAPRFFSTTRPSLKGLSPETDNPQPKESESHVTASGPAEITIEQFHEVADEYLNALIEKLEQLQEETEEVDVEYSVCASSLRCSVPLGRSLGLKT
jgi:frataxin